MNKSIFKLSYLLILLCVVASGCSEEVKKEKERPDNIIATKPCPTLYGSIMDQFPEYKNNEANQALLFDAKAEKHVSLVKESEVYVTYISEGAGYTNTFGWYSYNKSSPPQSVAELQLKVLFPTVNGKILKQGDMVKLRNETFAAGTVIGFFLIVGGWHDGAVDFSKPTLYTDYAFNPAGQQQHILFKQKDCGDVVLAFEDRMPGEGTDSDFNDIIFTVTDNRKDLEVSSLDLSTVVRM
jgi:hypothetical protein